MKNFEIRCDESRLEKNHTLYGKFTLGPFLPGQGTTFGNALRRSLLSELSGLAITAFEVIGVMQEFSTLPGLRESVLDLSLNLKQVVLTGKLPFSTPPIGFLKVRGPAIIYAADLKLPAGVYCASPEQYIATLASNGVLNLKFLVSVGKGHSTQPYSLYRSLSKTKLQPTLSTNSINKLHDTSLFDEEWKNSIDSIEKISNIKVNNFSQSSLESKNKKNNSNIERSSTPRHKTLNSKIFTESTNYDKIEDFNSPEVIQNNVNSTNLSGTDPSGYVSIQKQIFQRVKPHQVLPIDAVFTPVFQVNFLTQVNDRFETPRENVVLEIWTNGSIHPKRALEEATLSLVQNFDTLLKSIQQASSFYKGLRYWNSIPSVDKIENGLINEVDHHPLKSSILKEDIDIDEKNKIEDGLIRSPSVKEVDHHQKDSNNNKIKDFNLVDQNYHLPLHQAVYNLDIGNLDLSLETFILLKQARVKTLAHLLKNLNLKERNLFFKEKTINELNKIINQLGINLSL